VAIASPVSFELARVGSFPSVFSVWTMRFHSALQVSCVAIVLMAGCGESAAPKMVSVESSISGLARLYGEYASRHQQVGPPDEATFRSFIESLPAPQREAMGLGQWEQARISPRDNQPYEIRYGLRPLQVQQGRGWNGQAIVIHERQGAGGRRWVATGMGATAELTEDEFARAIR